MPPGVLPARGNYLMKDILRMGEYYGVPLRVPKNPFESISKGSMQAMRFITAMGEIDSSGAEELARQLWLRIWSRDEDITTNDSLRAAAEAAKIDPRHIVKALTQLNDADVKAKLKANTDEAVAGGAYGAPTIFVYRDGRQSMIFGSDRFPILASMLGGEWLGPHPPQASKL